MPCLLLDNGALVKTISFKNKSYIGDPINTVRIYNDQMVDELIFLDITASKKGNEPNFKLIEEIASECFMPFTYGGGISTLEQAKKLFGIGVEKVAINSAVFTHPSLIESIARQFGQQSIVGAMDVKKTMLGQYRVYKSNSGQKTKETPLAHANYLKNLGVGEILLTSINQDGVMAGFDVNLIKMVAPNIELPVIACGGAGELSDLRKPITEGGASALAVGSMVIYQGKNRSVLTNFPSQQKLKKALEQEVEPGCVI